LLRRRHIFQIAITSSKELGFLPAHAVRLIFCPLNGQRKGKTCAPDILSWQHALEYGRASVLLILFGTAHAITVVRSSYSIRILMHWGLSMMGGMQFSDKYLLVCVE
jgi:hypothetical protein